MRTVDESALLTLDGQSPALVMLVEMMLDEPIRLCTANRQITFGGHDYLAGGHIGSISEIEDSPHDQKSIQFTLSGVNSDFLAIARLAAIRNKACTIRLAILDPETHAVIDAPSVWSGSLDQMVIQMGAGGASISVTAEHRGTTYARPKPLRYTDADQQRLYQGDTSLRFLPSQANHVDVWPDKGFFRV